MSGDQSNASDRGAGAIDSKQQEEVSIKGGKTVQEKSSAHETTADEVRKGGLSSGNENKNRQDEQRNRREDWGGYKGY